MAQIKTVRWVSKKFFTIGEAAEVCKVSQQTIIRRFDAGQKGQIANPDSTLGCISRADLVDFMRDNGIPVDVLETGSEEPATFNEVSGVRESSKGVMGDELRASVGAHRRVMSARRSLLFVPFGVLWTVLLLLGLIALWYL